MPVTEKSLSNLRPVQRGEVRNPTGRPKLPDINAAIARCLGRVNPETMKDGLDEIMDAMRKKAARGDVKAAKFLSERGWGMPKQPIALSLEPVAIDFRDAE
jgi:hypothetical protein